MAAAGKKVSRSNLRTFAGAKATYTGGRSSPTISAPTSTPAGRSGKRKARIATPVRSKPVKASRGNILESPKVQTAIQSLRQKYAPGGRTRNEANIQTAIRDNTTLAPVAKDLTYTKAGKVKSYKGKPIAGTPAPEQLAAAKTAGQLRTDAGGRVTTPKVRQTRKKVRRVSARLDKARKASAKRINIAGEEGVFVNTLARKTGLSPKVVAAWTRSEGGNSTGDWNRLNIGHTDSGPIGLTADGGWSNPKTAAKLSAAFLKGEYGGASEGIKNILPASKGASDAQQIANIAGSGWATNPEYKGLITAVYGDVSEPVIRANPKKFQQVKKLAEDISAEARKLGLQGVKGLGKEGTRSVAKVFIAKKRNGDYAGSQQMVSQMLGSKVWGDKEPGHASGGDHDPTVGDAYAQDIQLGQDNPSEGEPTYDQALLDKITRRIRSMGGDIPDLQMGMGLTETNVQGYRVQIWPDSESNFHGSGPHLHIGAKWTGENPPKGTKYGGSGGSSSGFQTVSYPLGGGGEPSTSTSAPSTMAGNPRKGRKESIREALLDLGYTVTASGVKGGTKTAPVSAPSQVLAELSKKYK